MWVDRSRVNNGLREIKWTTQSATAEQVNPQTVKITAKLLGEGKNGFTVNHDVVYTITGDGAIKGDNTFSSSDPKQVLARMGVRMMLDKRFDRASYFGRGPMANYADRK